jgi:hypothetical protein
MSTQSLSRFFIDWQKVNIIENCGVVSASFRLFNDKEEFD